MANANAKDNSEKIVTLRLDEIEVQPKWNTRSNIEETIKGAEEAGTFADFQKSIFVEGQDTPIIVRPNKDGSKKPYFLVTGHRRYEAHQRIAAEGKTPRWATEGWCKNPTIRAEIRRLDDTAALELNLRENTEREDLTAPDLAFGIGRLCENYRTKNVKYTQQMIADKVGYSQAYVGKLMHIVGEGRYVDGKGVKKDIFENWRNAAIKITVAEMERVANAPPADQEKLYNELLRPEDGGKGKGQGDPMKAAAKAAENVGKLLGVLVREGALDIDLNDSEWWLSNIQHMVKIKNRVGKKGGTKPPTESQIAKVARAAEKAFAAAVTEAEETEEEDATPKGKRARGDAHAN